MHEPVTVLFRVKRTPHHNLLQCRPRSERTFILHTCCAGGSKWKNHLHHAVLLPEAGAMATHLSIADAQGALPGGVRNIAGEIPEARGKAD